jgi:hypothetical protein
VWNYDANGDFQGTINLSETVTLAQDGESHSGTVALDFYDSSGSFIMKVNSHVTAERISVK